MRRVEMLQNVVQRAEKIFCKQKSSLRKRLDYPNRRMVERNRSVGSEFALEL